MDLIKLRIPQAEGWSEAELYEFCRLNEGLRIEWDADKTLYLREPVGSYSSSQNSLLTADLTNWARQDGRGISFDSSAGFILPSGAMRSPDASWVSKEAWRALSFEEQSRFAPLCPAFVVELKSPSDSLVYLKNKMEEWISNGCQLAWLIDPLTEKVLIYRPEVEVEVIEDFSMILSGEAVLSGFEFDLTLLKEG